MIEFFNSLDKKSFAFGIFYGFCFCYLMGFGFSLIDYLTEKSLSLRKKRLEKKEEK